MSETKWATNGATENGRWYQNFNLHLTSPWVILNTIDKGVDSKFQRVGSNIRIKRFTYRFEIWFSPDDAANLDANIPVRFLHIRSINDVTPLDAISNNQQLFDPEYSTISGSFLTSFINNKEFKVVTDKWWVLNPLVTITTPNSVTSGQPMVKLYKKSHRINKTVKYNDTSLANGNNINFDLRDYFLFIWDDGVAASTFNIRWSARYSYTDI